MDVGECIQTWGGGSSDTEWDQNWKIMEIKNQYFEEKNSPFNHFPEPGWEKIINHRIVDFDISGSLACISFKKVHFFSHFRFKCGGCCWPIPLDWGTLILSNAQSQRIQMASQKSPSICKSLVFGKQFQSLKIYNGG